MSLQQQLDRERTRLDRMEAEADKALDSRGRRSPVDRRIIEGQRNLVRMVRDALVESETTGDSDA